MASGEFSFIGEALAFDFVNTEIVVRRKPVDLLNSPADLLDWWRAALDHYQLANVSLAEVSQPLFEKARNVRAALRKIFTAVVTEQKVRPSDLELLNDVLRSGYIYLVAMPDGRFAMRQGSDDENAMLLAIVNSAAWLLTECERERLHKCKNEFCVLMFLDTTKNSSRVWCSIDCMNRARSAERYRQAR